MAMIWDVMHFAYKWLSHMSMYESIRDLGTLKLAVDTTHAVVKAHTPRFLALLLSVKSIDIQEVCMKHVGDPEVHDMCREKIDRRMSDLYSNYIEGTSNDTMIWLGALSIVMLFRMASSSYRNSGIRSHLMVVVSIAIGWMTLGIAHAALVYRYLVNIPHTSTHMIKHQREIHSVISVLSVLTSMVIMWRSHGVSPCSPGGDRVHDEHLDACLGMAEEIADHDGAIGAINTTQEEHFAWLKDLEERVRALERPRMLA
jgi:hypothetical protein